MPRKLPIHVRREKTRHGRVVYYFRRGVERRTRLPDYGTAEFDPAYQRALAGQTTPVESRKSYPAHSLAWLIQQYRESRTYAELSKATRRQRDNIFLHVVEAAGREPFKSLTTAHIAQARDRRAGTPSQARNMLDAMRGLFRWAKEAQHVTDDPTEGITNPKRPKGGKGFAVWTVDDVAAYEARWPEGTRERVWLHVLLYTGLRRGDAVARRTGAGS